MATLCPVTRGRPYTSEMTDRSGPGPAEPRSGLRQRPERPNARMSAGVAPRSEDNLAARSSETWPGADAHPDARSADRRPADRRQQRRWVPLVASWVVRLLGLADIVLGLTAPTNDLHVRLQRLPVVVPGTVAALTRTADVIIGLLLLMLSHGLRRRKHRAWRAVMALLAISAVISIAHTIYLARHHAMAIGPTVGFFVVIAMIAAGFAFRGEFYAIGDPRTRWRALNVFVGLAAADLMIGLSFIALHGLATNYACPQRFHHVLYGLVGVSPPQRLVFGADVRGDLFNILTGALGFFTLLMVAYLFLRPATPEGRLSPAD